MLAPERQIAAFDLENTLIASNVVDVATPGWPRRRLDRRTSAGSWPTCCAEAPALLKLDRRDRSDFLRHFYRRYEDAPVDQLGDDAPSCSAS